MCQLLSLQKSGVEKACWNAGWSPAKSSSTDWKEIIFIKQHKKLTTPYGYRSINFTKFYSVIHVVQIASPKPLAIV
jgi:hypothetical protein